jgi:hypothetical protein
MKRCFPGYLLSRDGSIWSFETNGEVIKCVLIANRGEVP